MKGVLCLVPEIFAVEQLQLIGNQWKIALPQDRGDRLIGVERELPFLPNVIRRGGLWPDDQHQPLARGDRALNFLVKCQPARRRRHAVKPNFKTAGREIPVQPGNTSRYGERIESKAIGIAKVPVMELV